MVSVKTPPPLPVLYFFPGSSLSFPLPYNLCSRHKQQLPGSVTYAIPGLCIPRGPHTWFTSLPSLFWNSQWVLSKSSAFSLYTGSHTWWASLVFMFRVSCLFLTVFYLASFQILFKMQLKYHLASENYPEFLSSPAEGINGSFLPISWFLAIWHKLVLE